MYLSLFEGRELVIATMHGKEAVIAPVLQRELGVKICVPASFDTDRFGTFSGEVERPEDPLETARMKCRAAAELTGCSLAVASEGSFGPHPAAFFIPADDELMLLMDFNNGREYKAREVVTQTNFRCALLHTWPEVRDFAGDVLFPSHGLIVRHAAGVNDGIVKGVRDWETLEAVANRILNGQGEVFVETDMRAMHNPTRIKVIAQAAERLAASVKQLCPACSAPGYEVSGVRQGMPCELCGSPTKSTLAHIWSCIVCGHKEENLFPHDKTTESAMYCDWCNP